VRPLLFGMHFFFFLVGAGAGPLLVVFFSALFLVFLFLFGVLHRCVCCGTVSLTRADCNHGGGGVGMRVGIVLLGIWYR
jgi:hypothetical protein